MEINDQHDLDTLLPTLMQEVHPHKDGVAFLTGGLDRDYWFLVLIFDQVIMPFDQFLAPERLNFDGGLDKQLFLGFGIKRVPISLLLGVFLLLLHPSQRAQLSILPQHQKLVQSLR